MRLLSIESLESRALLAANLVADIALNGGSNPHDLVQSGAITFLVANDGTSGDELWRTDGTAAGTARVKDIFPGITSSTPQQLTDVNGTLFFTADNGLAGTELWKSNGTADGTVLVKNVRSKGEGSAPRELTVVGSKLFFVADDGEHGAELWISDGSPQGTKLVKDIVAGASSSNPQHLTTVNNRLFFTALDADHGIELWASDGTADGTVLVKDVLEGEESSRPAELTAVNNRLFFTATTDTNGTELWVSDGTAAGTDLIRDIRSGTQSSQPAELTNVAGVAYFRANDGVAGVELWRSDGTASGTTLVSDIRTGESGSTLSELTDVNGQLYFRANDGLHGEELWTSDGTLAGTRLVVDLENGADSSDLSSLTAFDGQVYFSANNADTGTELWRSDGSPDGTFVLRDIRAAALSSFPAVLGSAGDKLYFTADNGLLGRELWAFRETLGTVEFRDSSSTTTEGAAGLTMTVPLTTDGDPLDSDLSVDVTLVDGTAADGVDTTSFGTVTVTFPRGSTGGATATVEVFVTDDAFVEAEESLRFQLQNLAGHGFIADGRDEHVVTITDNDFASIRFVASESSADEASAGTVIMVQLVTIPTNATLASETAVTVARIGGTTAANADLQSFAPTTFTFPAGTGSGAERSLTLVPLEDRLVEGEETIQLGLQDVLAPLSIDAGAQQHVLTIHDLDTATVEFVAAESTADENGGVHLQDVRLVITPPSSELATNVSVRVTRTGGTATNSLDHANFAPATLRFAAGVRGTATQQIGLAVLPDELVETSETVALELTTVSGPVAVNADARQHVVSITDADLAEIRFDDNTTSVGENIGEYLVTARLVLTPATARLAADVSFQVQRSGGTALNGVDHDNFASQTLTFVSGSQDGDQQSAPLAIINDDLVEGSETVELELAGLSGPATLAVQFGEQTLTITDGDFATVSFVTTTSSLNENGVQHGIPVRLTTIPETATLAFDSTMDLFVTGGSATNGVDYAEFVPLRLAFDAGAANGLTRTVRLTPTDDGVFEGDESVTFGLRNAKGVVTQDAAADTHVATIIDDEIDPDIDDDGDGVPSAIESQSPHEGDGNQDGVPDQEQGSVASFANAVDGSYITLVAGADSTLLNVRPVTNPDPVTTPIYAAFPWGFFEFAAQVAEPGGVAEVQLITSSLLSPTIYLQYGPDNISALSRWLLLHDNGTTGARFAPNEIDLQLIDGGRGDADLTTDGLVRVLAAPGLNQSQHPWQNPAAATDVNGDQFISPLDALVVINALAASTDAQLPIPLVAPHIPPNFVDVSGDDQLSPLDALLVVNDLHLNGIRVVIGVGGTDLAEGEASAAPASGFQPLIPIRAASTTSAVSLPDSEADVQETTPILPLPASPSIGVPTHELSNEHVSPTDHDFEDLLSTLAQDLTTLDVVR